MKITDDEILRIAVRHDIDAYLTEALTIEFVRDVLQAVRRTTPDREAIIEECAGVCDGRYMGLDNPEDLEALRCARDIRALKTAPNGEKGGAS